MKADMGAMLKAIKGLQAMADEMIASGHGESPEAGEGIVEQMGEMGDAQESLSEKVKEAEADELGCDDESVSPGQDLMKGERNDYFKKTGKSSTPVRKELMIFGLGKGAQPKAKGKM